MSRIVVAPLTRLEGGGRIEIEASDKGELSGAWLVRAESAASSVCQGRPIEEMPRIASLLFSASPASHHLAAARAADAACGVKVLAEAARVRELYQCAHVYAAHLSHFYTMALPDFLAADAPPERRGFPGLVGVLGATTLAEVFRQWANARYIQEIIGGRGACPVHCLPGGVTSIPDARTTAACEEKAKQMLEFARFTTGIFSNAVLENARFMKLLRDVNYTVETYHMGLVDSANKVSFCEGNVRVVDPDGGEMAHFAPADYQHYIGERSEDWSPLKFTYLTRPGWKGLIEGKGSGIYRVGPLARITAADGMATRLAQAEYDRMYAMLGIKPIHHAAAMHWARLVELIYAAERILELCRDNSITGAPGRQAAAGGDGEGVGAVESPEGIIFHHYQTDGSGLVTKAGFISAAAANNAGMNLSVRRVLEGAVRDGDGLNQRSAERALMALRAY